jgi:hypothetical protein
MRTLRRRLFFALLILALLVLAGAGVLLGAGRRGRATLGGVA